MVSQVEHEPISNFPEQGAHSSNFSLEANTRLSRRQLLKAALFTGTIVGGTLLEQQLEPLTSMVFPEEFKNHPYVKKIIPLTHHEMIEQSQLIVFGDSIARGVQDTDAHLFVSASDFVAQKLNGKGGDWGAPVYFAVGGNTTVDTIEQIQSWKAQEIIHKEADPYYKTPHRTVVIHAGPNDIAKDMLGNDIIRAKVDGMVTNFFNTDWISLPEKLQTELTQLSENYYMMLKEVSSLPQKYGGFERIVFIGTPNLSMVNPEKANLLDMAAGPARERQRYLLENNTIVQKLINNICMMLYKQEIKAITKYYSDDSLQNKPEVILLDTFHLLEPADFPNGEHPTPEGQKKIGDLFLQHMNVV